MTGNSRAGRAQRGACLHINRNCTQQHTPQVHRVGSSSPDGDPAQTPPLSLRTPQMPAAGHSTGGGALSPILSIADGPASSLPQYHPYPTSTDGLALPLCDTQKHCRQKLRLEGAHQWLWQSQAPFFQTAQNRCAKSASRCGG